MDDLKCINLDKAEDLVTRFSTAIEGLAGRWGSIAESVGKTVEAVICSLIGETGKDDRCLLAVRKVNVPTESSTDALDSSKVEDPEDSDMEADRMRCWLC